jgi:hypothetical protein
MTPDAAREQANALLATLYANVTNWTTALLDQALLAIASDDKPFGMNDLRTVLPEDACKQAGLYFHSLVNLEHPEVLRQVGEVRSINPKAHGKKVGVYVLTSAGRKFIHDRQAARTEQRKAAAA